LLPAGADNPGTTAHSAQSPSGEEAQVPSVAGEEVGDLVFFEMSPQALDRIELGSIGGQASEPQPLTSFRQQCFDRLAPVDGGAVPDHQQIARNADQEFAQEIGRLGAPA
jgi:hypothetical protein